MSEPEFRWQAFFARAVEPLFVLNRQQYLLHCNEAFRHLAELPSGKLKRLSCAARAFPSRNSTWRRILAYLLTPPPEVLGGKATRVRRLVPEREGHLPHWWDIDFFPLMEESGFRGLLGKIVVGPVAKAAPAPVIPESLVNLRLRAIERNEQCYFGPRLPSLKRLQAQLRVASQSSASVVLVGAEGTGKRTLARLIHLRGEAKERSFAALDCRRLPAFAVGAILWGESGLAGRSPLGTIYLNEPSYLPREIQERLVGWLTMSEKRPRLLSGFLADPAEAVRQGTLLVELRHALDTFRIDVPTLAERRDDLPHLVDLFLRRQNADDGKTIHGLTPDAWEVLLAYSWPGNLSELFGTLLSARQHASKDAIDVTDLPATIRQLVKIEQTPANRSDTQMAIRPLMERVERRLIELALHRTNGHKRRTAKLLAVHVPWLYKRLNELGLISPRIEVEDEEEATEE